MADKIIIEGVAAYEGEYDVSLSDLTNRELHTIKRISGVRAGELAEAFAARDNDLALACAVIALQRAGKPVIEDILWDAEGGNIRLVLGGDESPPEEAAQKPPSGPPSSDGGKKTGSGKSSGDRSESQVTTP